MLCDDLIRVATLARNRSPAQAFAATKGRHLGFAPDEAHRRGGVPFPAKMAATNKCLARSNNSRTGAEATNKRPAERRNFLGPPTGETPLGG